MPNKPGKFNVFAITALGDAILPYPQEIYLVSDGEIQFVKEMLQERTKELEEWLLANEVECAAELRNDEIAELQIEGYWRSMTGEQILKKILRKIKKLWECRRLQKKKCGGLYFCGPVELQGDKILADGMPIWAPSYGNGSEYDPIRRLSVPGSFVHWLRSGGLNSLPEDATLAFAGYPNWAKDVDKLRGVVGPRHRLVVEGRPALLRGWKFEQALGGELSIYANPPQEWLMKRDWNKVRRPWPKITVVMPSFNQVKFVREALNSIFSQNYPNLETIILDPGSTDGTREILREYKDKITHLILEPDKGQSDALQRGLNMASGAILTWLCTDDMLEPGALFHVAEAFKRYGSDIVVGGCRRIDEDGNELEMHFSAMPFNQVTNLDFLGIIDVLKSWQAGHFFYQPEVFFTKDIWRRAGGFFHTSAYYAMDYDLWARMALAGATGVQIFHPVAGSRAQRVQKTQLGEKPVYLWPTLNFLKIYNKIMQKAQLMANDDI